MSLLGRQHWDRSLPGPTVDAELIAFLVLLSELGGSGHGCSLRCGSATVAPESFKMVWKVELGWPTGFVN